MCRTTARCAWSSLRRIASIRSEETRLAFDAVLEYVRNNGLKPRYRGNRLIFLAPDHGTLARLRDCRTVALAWGSIVDDVKDGRLNIDQLQKNQAEKELQTAEEVLPRTARECYKWLLCPAQDTRHRPEAHGRGVPAEHAGGSSLAARSSASAWTTSWSSAPGRRSTCAAKLQGAVLEGRQDRRRRDGLLGRHAALPLPAAAEETEVLEQAIRKGAASRDFFGTAYGQSGSNYDGFKLGDANVQFDDTLLLIEPAAAAAYEAANRPPAPELTLTPNQPPGGTSGSPQPGVAPPVTGGVATKPRAFHATAVVPAATAKMRLVEIAEEIVSVLASDPNATVRLAVEISADFPDGASESMKRAVSENARSLGISKADWE